MSDFAIFQGDNGNYSGKNACDEIELGTAMSSSIRVPTYAKPRVPSRGLNDVINDDITDPTETGLGDQKLLTATAEALSQIKDENNSFSSNPPAEDENETNMDSSRLSNYGRYAKCHYVLVYTNLF